MPERIARSRIAVAAAGPSKLRVSRDTGANDPGAVHLGPAHRDPPLAMPVRDPVRGVLELRRALPQPCSAAVFVGADLLDAQAHGVERHLGPGLPAVTDVSRVVALRVVRDV